MKPKKAPKCDLQALSGVFFAIGLVIVTCFSLLAINTEFKKSPMELVQFPEVNHSLDEPIFQIVVEPPLPTQPLTTYVYEGGCRLPLDTLDILAVKDTLLEPEQDIPYHIVQDKPKFEACKDVLGEEFNRCFKQELDKHVKAHFSYPEDCRDICVQGRVLVKFRITQTGEVEVMQTRGPHPSLERKAAEIIEKLPRFISGTSNGQPVNVLYIYPITFKLQS
ncbi:energy transducer TonB [Capnocytophaga canimorsus]|uniref:energy transducer TonB n=1 Tax=Capnocytophaga canimorsus TaxID=28188 RepID=UPI00385D0B6A